jgi:hypothetical protein
MLSEKICQAKEVFKQKKETPFLFLIKDDLENILLLDQVVKTLSDNNNLKMDLTELLNYKLAKFLDDLVSVPSLDVLDLEHKVLYDQKDSFRKEFLPILSKVQTEITELLE